jgi:hypothetical protein
MRRGGWKESSIEAIDFHGSCIVGKQVLNMERGNNVSNNSFISLNCTKNCLHCSELS